MLGRVEDVDVLEVEEVEEVVDFVEVTASIGIWPMRVATGLIRNISAGLSQHAKLPTPVPPRSQQYSLVDVIAPWQKRIPALESGASGILVSSL